MGLEMLSLGGDHARYFAVSSGRTAAETGKEWLAVKEYRRSG
jgi:hypothetical protein